MYTVNAITFTIIFYSEDLHCRCYYFVKSALYQRKKDKLNVQFKKKDLNNERNLEINCFIIS